MWSQVKTTQVEHFSVHSYEMIQFNLRTLFQSRAIHRKLENAFDRDDDTET